MNMITRITGSRVKVQLHNSNQADLNVVGKNVSTVT